MGMCKINTWCSATDEKVKTHQLRILEGDPAKITIGVEAIAKVVPNHYASKERVAQLMRKLGKKKTAKFIEQKLPTSKSIRSGDLGEILGASYVAEFTGYTTGINRLRWKDHREMAMRGDDIIALRPDPSDKVKFLKGEVKSNMSLSGSTVAKAHKALQSNNGRPSGHALSFLADRLHEKGEHALADLIDAAQLRDGIKPSQISHLMFTFSANDPRKLLRNNLNTYKGKILQHAVGLRITGHQAFIKAVYEEVIANGGNY